MSPQNPHRYIYKILPTAPPDTQPQSQSLSAAYELSALDRSSGYIHLSTATQVPQTANRFFNTHTTLWVLKLRTDYFEGHDGTRGEVKWEDVVVGGGGDDVNEVFPHLYGGRGLGPFNVLESKAFERREGSLWSEVMAVGEGEWLE